jgi:lipid kinase YegS
MKKNIHIIVNQKAYLDENLHIAVDMVRKKGYKVEVNPIWESRDTFRLAQEAIEKGAHIIIAAGGDGTINAVVNEFIKKEPQNCVLSTLPYGTANDFALANDFIEDDPMAMLHMITETEPVMIDVIRCNDYVFVNSCTGGYGTHVTTETSPKLKSLLGGFAYFVTGVTSLTDLKGLRAEIKGKDLNWEGDLISIVIGNGCQAGGGVIISSNALINDGLFEGIILPDFDFSDIFTITQVLTQDNKSAASEKLIEFRDSQLEIKTDSRIQFNLDGEPIKGSSFVLKVLPREVPFILPVTSKLIKPD